MTSQLEPPMTDLDRPWVVDSTPSERFPLYTRANVAEVAPNVMAPLFSTMVAGWRGERRWRQALVDFGVFDLDEFRENDVDIMPVFYGYIYLNVSVHRVLGVRSPGVDANAMDVAFFGENPDVPPHEPHPDDDNPKYELRVGESIQRVLATTSRPDLDEDRAAAAKLRQDRPDLASMSDEELVSFAREIINGQFRHNHEKVYTLVHESSIPVAMLHHLLSGVRDAPALVQLLSGIGQIDSAEPTREMWQLSRIVRSAESLSRQFDAGVSGLLERLRGDSDASSAQFLEAFHRFLLEYGSRGTNEWDVCTVTWETHPDIPLAMIERMRLQDDAQSPGANADRLRADRERLTADLRAQLSGSPETLVAFDQALNSAVAYMVARERNKTTSVRVLQEARLAIRELGSRMVARGHFDKWDDINMIREDELDALLQEPAEHGRIAKTRLEWADQLQQLSPPFIIHGHVPPPSTWQKKTGESATPAAAGEQLHGLAACPGHATGRARVIKDPADAHDLGVGEVLVAPMTDPGWTPLFTSAAAIVVDVGSQLSHAAIVSRELGIPCVVGLSKATLRIPNGAMISVDGSTGVVTIL